MADSVIKVEFPIKVTDEDIDDIMCTALEGGINYWCRRADVVGDYLGEYASEQISRGGQLKLYEAEDDGEFLLNKEHILSGILQYVLCPDSSYRILREGVDGFYLLECGMIDAEVADSIIQYGLFNEIVYG